MFLPRECLHCCKIIPTKNNLYFCKECYSHLISQIINSTNTSDFLAKNNIPVNNIFSLFKFEKETPSQSLIHNLKYKSQINIGIELGKMLSQKFELEINRFNIDILIPVPLHLIKKFSRGYNQTEFIAKGISGFTKIPTNPNVLKRNKYTRSQTKFSKEERKLNIQEAFKLCTNADIVDKRIALVDDVITTGSTISECSEILFEAGAKKVYAMSIALVI